MKLILKRSGQKQDIERHAAEQKQTMEVWFNVEIGQLQLQQYALQRRMNYGGKVTEVKNC